MALKFLNKKGWHTGSLRNIENVWKAEQKHEAEQKKLEELRKQIHEEKERSEFRRLQEQAGLVPRQERLEFLYDSGLSVGKPSSSDAGFKALEALPQPTTNNEVGASTSAAAATKQDAVPGALFEEKQHSANDSWRKLHSDPLLTIRQREQESIARIKNNPVQMANIRKSVELKKHEDDDSKKSKKAKRKHKKHSSSKYQSDSEDDERKHKKRASSKHQSDSGDDRRKHQKIPSSKYRSDLEDEDRKRKKHSSSKYPSEEDARDKETQSNKESKHRSSRYKEFNDNIREKSDERATMEHRDSEREFKQPKYRERSPVESREEKGEYHRQKHEKSQAKDERTDKPVSGGRHDYRDSERESKQQKNRERSPVESRVEKAEYQRQKHEKSQAKDERNDNKAVAGGRYDSGSPQRRRNIAPKLSEEERAARLREMQMDAELHEEQRWKRLKKADENDAKEAARSVGSRGKSFLDDAQKSVYGAEQGSSSLTVEESVRRRSHFLQSRSAAEGNAFRR